MFGSNSGERGILILLPFLRWAGGKRKLAEMITGCFPESFWNSNLKYFEPFVGGGAIMLHVGDQDHDQYIAGNRVHINDMNPDLICTYEVIRDDVESLISELTNLSSDLSKTRYLEIRAQNDLQGVKRAARFIYLNKTGFNGLWRVNSKGEYNVPWGQLKNPTIFDSSHLRNIAKRLIGVKIAQLNFDESVMSAAQDDIVYFDPPYIPLSHTASFSQYAMADFGLAEQQELASTIKTLTDRSVFVILSNSDTELSREIFGKYLNLYQIEAPRAIAAKASSRGTVKEILGCSRLLPAKKLPNAMKLISSL